MLASSLILQLAFAKDFIVVSNDKNVSLFHWRSDFCSSCNWEMLMIEYCTVSVLVLRMLAVWNLYWSLFLSTTLYSIMRLGVTCLVIKTIVWTVCLLFQFHTLYYDIVLCITVQINIYLYLFDIKCAMSDSLRRQLCLSNSRVS